MDWTFFFDESIKYSVFNKINKNIFGWINQRIFSITQKVVPNKQFLRFSQILLIQPNSFIIVQNFDFYEQSRF